MGRGVNTVRYDTSFWQYLRGKLGHLTSEEKSVMELVLVKYRHVFHGEGCSYFQSTDLVKYRIVTSDAKSIRKPLYRVPFSLRREMENQVEDVLEMSFLTGTNLE